MEEKLTSKSLQSKKQSFVKVFLFTFCIHCFVPIPLCFIWLLEPERLAFGNKSLWTNILCALESKSVTPVCTPNCAPLPSPDPVLKLEAESLANLAGCQEDRPILICFGSPVFCQLAILSQALIPHYLDCKFHGNIAMLVAHPVFETNDSGSMSQGHSPAFQ